MARVSYTAAMTGDSAHIRLRLETKQPIALSDFVSNFVGIGNQFEKFISTYYPDLRADSEIFVSEVRAGSIEADLVAWVLGGGAAGAFLVSVDAIDKAQIMTKFIGDLKARITPYFKPGGRSGGVTKSDLNDFLKTVRAVASDPSGANQLEAAAYEDGDRKVRAVFRFDTSEAREAERQLDAHKREMESGSDADHSRVLMRFVRPSIEPTKTHRKTGERAIIEAIHNKPLAVVYASDLARERVAYELTQLDINVFRLLFDVDVNVEISAGRPVAYRIVAVHDVTDIPDDDD